jgi:glutaredoxin
MSNVIIYTATGCSHCHEAKEFFREHGIQYTEINITEDKEAKREIMKKGVMSAPYIIVDGQEYRSFDREQFEELFKK